MKTDSTGERTLTSGATFCDVPALADKGIGSSSSLHETKRNEINKMDKMILIFISFSIIKSHRYPPPSIVA